MNMRILLLLLFIPVLGFSQETKPQTSLQTAVDALMNDPVLKNASFSFYAVDLNTGARLGEFNKKQSLITASTMKLVTSSAALEILGASYRFKTRIQHDGHIDSLGVLHGNLFIKGGGDPALGSKYFEKHYAGFKDKWVEAIQAAGIKKIKGRIIADATIYAHNVVPAGWSWSDIGNYYGAAANGLTVYDNLMKLQFSSGPNPGDSTVVECTDPFVPELIFDNKVVAANSKKDNAYVYGAPYSPYRIIEGSIPKGQESFEVKASIPDPAYLLALELEHMLYQKGVRFGNPCSTVRRLGLYEGYVNNTKNRTDIHTTKSPYLTNIIYWVNMVSVNLFAEHLLKSIAIVKYGNGTTFSGALAVTKHFQKKGIDLTGFYMNDGSGLTRSNAVSAKHFVDILKYMSGSTNGEKLKKSLPVAGVSGTLRSIGRKTAAQGKVIGKSGTMTRVKSYAGYATSTSGKKIAYAMIINNYNCTSYQVKLKFEKLMVAMAKM